MSDERDTKPGNVRQMPGVPEDDDSLQKLAGLMAKHGSPVGRLKGLLYEALLSDAAKALPARTHVLVLVEFAAKLARAAGMSLEELQSYLVFAYVDRKALLSDPEGA